MADIIDTSNERTELELDLGQKAVRAAVARMPEGEAGECDHCGEYFERTVGGACGFCRDKLGLP